MKKFKALEKFLEFPLGRNHSDPGTDYWKPLFYGNHLPNFLVQTRFNEAIKYVKIGRHIKNVITINTDSVIIRYFSWSCFSKSRNISLILVLI